MSVSCPACGSGDPSTPIPVPDREYALEHVATYATCRSCATVFQSPMPAVAELPRLYPENYHSQTGQGPVGRFRHDVRLRRLSALAGDEGPMLDFGCGNGAFLVHAAARRPRRGYFGFEIADRSEVVTLEGGTVTIVRGHIDALMEKLPNCRVITMNHVIEHLPDPLAVVSALAAKLEPGGLLEGQTPAAGSLEHRVFGTRWSGYHSPRHTVVFSRVGLVTLLLEAGMVDVSVRSAFNPAGMAVSLASLPQGSRGGTVRRQGAPWLGFLAMATFLAPVDLLSGSSGIVNFVARRPR